MFAQHPGLVNKSLTVSQTVFLQSVHHCLGRYVLSVILRVTLPSQGTPDVARSSSALTKSIL
jgi:hypothetical protein